MSLFLNEPQFPDFRELAGQLSLKLADLRLPYDESKWDDEIVDALHEQHPYLPKGQVKISLNIRDGKNGYAVGNISLDDRVRLPVIVDNFHLKPFDMFMKEGELHAMTKESIMGALQHTEFGETVSPGQGESSDVFMTHSRPPFDGKYTFASFRKTANQTAQANGLIEQAMERLKLYHGMMGKTLGAHGYHDQALGATEDEHMQHLNALRRLALQQLEKDVAGGSLTGDPSVEFVGEDTPQGLKFFFRELAKAQAQQQQQPKLGSWTEGDPKKVEEALTNVFQPDGAEYFLHGDERMKKILDATMSGTKKYQHMKHHGHVYEPGGPLKRNTPPSNAKKVARLIKDPDGEWTREAGIVETTTPTGRKVAGMVFDHVYDLQLGLQDRTRFVPLGGEGYSDGAVFVTDRIKTAEEIKAARDAFPASTPQSGQTGMWIWTEVGNVVCTDVVTVLDKTAQDEVFRVKSAGIEKTIAQHPLIEVAVRDKEVLYLPKHATFVGVTDKKLTFGPSSNVVSEEFFTVQERGGRYKVAFYISPEKRRKLGRTQYDDMSEPKVANLLGRFFEPESVDTVLLAAKRAGVGVKVAFGDVVVDTVDQKALDGAVQKAVKTAQRLAPSILAAVLRNKAVDPTPLRKLAVEVAPKDWKVAELMKVATDYDEDDDAMTVDRALDLNILSPQNITKYVDGINLLERARQFILKLLLASRLGLGIDPDAARTAAFSMDEVIRDLQQLRNVSTAGE